MEASTMQEPIRYRHKTPISWFNFSFCNTVRPHSNSISQRILNIYLPCRVNIGIEEAVERHKEAVFVSLWERRTISRKSAEVSPVIVFLPADCVRVILDVKWSRKSWSSFHMDTIKRIAWIISFFCKVFEVCVFMCLRKKNFGNFYKFQGIFFSFLCLCLWRYCYNVP